MEIAITFKLDNDVFKHDDGTLDYSQVSEIIWKIQNTVSKGVDGATIRDDNRNIVGKWGITGK